jgi:hypothetical protein
MNLRPSFTFYTPIGSSTIWKDGSSDQYYPGVFYGPVARVLRWGFSNPHFSLSILNLFIIKSAHQVVCSHTPHSSTGSRMEMIRTTPSKVNFKKQTIIYMSYQIRFCRSLYLPSQLSSGCDSAFFHKREFSFTIEDDIYIRYQCFRDIDELKAGIQKRQPHKIDIGAVFTHFPKDHTTV